MIGSRTRSRRRAVSARPAVEVGGEREARQGGLEQQYRIDLAGWVRGR